MIAAGMLVWWTAWFRSDAWRALLTPHGDAIEYGRQREHVGCLAALWESLRRNLARLVEVPDEVS